MTPSKTEISSVLVDVRRAYRLLYDYQSAALDAVKYVGSQLGFSYRDGYPRFSDAAPRRGKGAFDCWAWDWLNFVHFDFNFYRTTEATQELGLSIMLFSDSGFYISENQGAVKTDTTTFALAEHSETKIGFVLYRVQEWQEEWDELFYEKDAIRRFLQHDGDLHPEIRNSGAFGKCFDFAQLADETSTEAVITELIRTAEAHGFPLERIKKAV
jgi:hypothetical protein